MLGCEGDRGGRLGGADASQHLGRDEVDHPRVRRELHGARLVISPKVFIESFDKSQSLHKFVKSSFILLI